MTDRSLVVELASPQVLFLVRDEITRRIWTKRIGRTEFQFTFLVVTDLQQTMVTLQKGSWDMVIIDYRLNMEAKKGPLNGEVLIQTLNRWIKSGYRKEIKYIVLLDEDPEPKPNYAYLAPPCTTARFLRYTINRVLERNPNDHI